MQRQFSQKQNESSAGLCAGFAALFVVGYVMGSPGVAPMLPPVMERTFTRLHQDLTDAGMKAYVNGSVTMAKLGIVEQ